VPSYALPANMLNYFKSRLDNKHLPMFNLSIIYNFRMEIQGTRSRTEAIFNNCYYDKKAEKPNVRRVVEHLLSHKITQQRTSFEFTPLSTTTICQLRYDTIR